MDTQTSSSNSCNLSLPTDVWTEHIIHFLGIRELLYVCSLSKATSSVLTHELVFKAALTRGGFPATSVSRVLNLVERRINPLPSPMRLLRVANGRRCERLADCEFGLKRKTVNAEWGVFMCDNCVKDHINRIRTNNIVIWQKPYVDRCHEAVGPPKRNDSITTSRAYVPASAVTEEVKRTIRLFKRTKEPFDAAAAAKRKREDDAFQAGQAKKAKKVEEIVESIYAKLKHKEWADIALAEDEDGNLLAPLVQNMMVPIEHAPSKVTKSTINKIAKDIAEIFDFLYEEKIHDVSWIKDVVPKANRIDANRHSTFEDALKDEMRDEEMWELSPEDIYFHRLADDTMVDLVRGGRKVEALARFSTRPHSFCGHALKASLPICPEASHYVRSKEICSLFHRLTSYGYNNFNISEWRKDFDYTIKVYNLCKRQVEKYTSLDWIEDEEKKRRMRRDRDLMKRMRDVLFTDASPIPYNYSGDDHLLLNYLLIDNNLDGDFPALLAYQKKRMGRGTKGMPKKLEGQRDIRGFFGKK